MSCKVVGTLRCRCGDRTSSPQECINCVGMLRKLFSDHSNFTLLYIQAVVFNTPFMVAYRKRLLENQTEIGKEIGRAFIGAIRGKALGSAFTQHIAAAEQMVLEMLGGQTTNMKTEFLQQGDELARLIASDFKKNEDDIIPVIRTHNTHVIRLTEMLIKSRVKDPKNPRDETLFIQELDAYNNHMLSVADFLFMAGEQLL